MLSLLSLPVVAQETQPAQEQPTTTEQTTPSQPDTTAQATRVDDDPDLGWIGLLGLLGLAGLIRRREPIVTTRTTGSTTGTTPRV
jgi:MYXO-CTERM domain-containing protein